MSTSPTGKSPAGKGPTRTGPTGKGPAGKRPAGKATPVPPSPAPGDYLAQKPRPGRILLYVVLFVLGLLVGAAGALVQGGLFPGGLLLALAGSAGLYLGGAALARSRAGAVAPAGGWLVAVLLLTATRPEGDFMFAAGAGSYLFLLGGMAVAVMCATLGRGPQPDGRPVRLGK
ncbi:DUF6113 family protein [Streptomyces sp. NPDC091292]|uniref:DUF6113 family protein n=1 Tax=Streptomyces sp. NPDC091292 TaxID=3365991 RepID=UPI0038282047